MYNSVINVTTNGEMYFIINFDETPDGFLDTLDDSHFAMNLRSNTAYAEYDTRHSEDHQDPRSKACDFNIDGRRICAKLELHSANLDQMVIKVKPMGPKELYLKEAFQLGVAPKVGARLHYDEEGLVKSIITFDVIPF